MRAARAGEEAAFVRLWRDANPAVVRYLRVVGHDDPYDEACEGWVTIVRGLPGFTGDETEWRVWVLACARQRAEESTLRRSWGSATGSLVLLNGDDDIDLDDILEPEDVVDSTHRGVADTLTALRELPLGQGELVVLRLGAELPVSAVASVVGVEEEFVERAEARALERLGTDAELVAWSLGAPATRAELADENIAVGAFRKVVARAEKVKVIAVGGTGGRSAGRKATLGLVGIPSTADSRNGARPNSRSATRRDSRNAAGSASGVTRVLAVVDSRNHHRSRRTSVVGRSRTAALALTALSVSVVSLGGFAAAAYVGVLPAPVQQALHDSVGAPAPGARDAGSSSRGPATSPTAAVGPTANAAAAGQCRAWSTDKAKGTARENSVAFRNLATAAGGPDKVQAYCATVLAGSPSHGSPTARGTSPAATPKGTGKGTGNGTGKPTTRPGSTRGATSHPAQGKSTTTKSSTSKSTTSKSTTSKSTPTPSAQPKPAQTEAAQTKPAQATGTAPAAPKATPPGPQSPKAKG
jgi:DNA-directed RNA polymerase specialized sigma24 family protein